MIRPRRAPSLPLLVLPVVLMLATTGCSWGLLRGYAEGRPTALRPALATATDEGRGVVHFTLDDLGTMNTDALETHALPWKVAAAALILDRRARGEPVPAEPDAVHAILQDFGFIVPDTLLNWKGAPYPADHALHDPVGVLRGTVRRGFPRVELEVASLGCASCHAGVTWDAEGRPTRKVWLGLPNTSLDLGAYTEALHGAFGRAGEDPEAVLAMIDTLYPDLREDERQTIEGHVLPELSEELPRLTARFGTLTPFHPGGPGAPNAVGSLKRMLGMLEYERDDELSLAQIPDLGDRVLRSSLTVDGVYRIPGKPRFFPMTRDSVTDEHLDGLARIAAFFTVPAMGGDADEIDEIVPRVRTIFDFLERYRPPPFPGPVDSVLARDGRVVYDEGCAACHGTYSAGLPELRLVTFPNRWVPGDSIGTDPVRWQSARPEVLAELKRVEYARSLDPRSTGGYVAPPLTGLWATAPYLHNASVPTLWHLMHPDERPTRFEVGGHGLDWERMGIDGALDGNGVFRYPDGYQPWSVPALYDTRVPGQSNGGHRIGFEGLSEREKRALLEFLKLL